MVNQSSEFLGRGGVPWGEGSCIFLGEGELHGEGRNDYFLS